MRERGVTFDNVAVELQRQPVGQPNAGWSEFLDMVQFKKDEELNGIERETGALQITQDDKSYIYRIHVTTRDN